MSWQYGFRPYVSVAHRRRQAAQEMEKRRKKGLDVSPIAIKGRLIARTFWGQAWCDNLESYSDFANRLPRGRTYVRNGSVVHLQIHRGKISAFVSGSELYSVEITISSLKQPHWKKIKTRCSGQIGSLVELLQGRLSRSVMDVVTERGEGLFPKPGEIKMRCSCPDWAGMCKHVAAVMYGVGARLDDRPELLFLLREVDHLELIQGAVGSRGTVDPRALRDVALVRYDALNEMSGHLSFSVALLNSEGHGIVLSSINSRAETRSYIKPVVAGEGTQELSPEEAHAVRTARLGEGMLADWPPPERGDHGPDHGPRHARATA